MNDSASNFIAAMLRDLRSFVSLAEETLALSVHEGKELAGPGNYQSFEFYNSRKDLLARLEPMMIMLKQWRQRWQQISPIERRNFSDATNVIQTLQDLLGRILQLDRENQQALLRRGLVPARHVTTCAAPPSHFIANLYRRHSISNPLQS